MSHKPNCAILDDYQAAALASADWAILQDRLEIRRYGEHLGDEDAVAAELADCTIIVAMRERTAFSKSLLERLPNLKLLITTGMRNRSIDMEAARSLTIQVCGTRSERGPASELAWAGLLAFMRNIPQETANFREGGPWQLGLGRSLEGRRLGIVGLGKQGKRMAGYGKAFGMEVCSWTRSNPEQRASELDIKALSLDDLFATSDVITIQLALTDETRGFVTSEMLQRMRPDAVLVNSARGPLVDEKALIECLQEKRIGGAVLDVFDTEPLPLDHPFRSLANVLATPHVGYVTQENYAVYFNDAIENIDSWLKGVPLRVLA
ncbi:D-2-hydroxyacid dehydrogenase family protein [Cohaesibacter celericrescens]|uniref:Hydroxyacid dehydrogenase n=1 Tax=Cohaesibacter celericrescens TaxID=2067669 RepID=A0A2N5XX92_9HYPH|nr:D-2-hydroxyacid dehydrogenase family protein [Cohaesibacter celericrescens]PLW79038.1 hydroxyacid dehydrogenase [Cohaesibacter celericrescens]